MAGKRVLQRFSTGVQANEPRTWSQTLQPFWLFGDKMKFLEFARIMVLSLLGTEFWRILYDVTSYRKRYKYRTTQMRNQSLLGVLTAVRADRY
ncbi:hypothetical protein AVEN_82518-1 [Araneus ventricosus]|uniref:Uncharacterized protein n=1 Tax=Araneus ventricosus TaxID=182803 RepID=A0A4Y2K6K9_ARAVE|nr:hypothetical protein AVEN_82518-1 [Araneus ventricosus]